MKAVLEVSHLTKQFGPFTQHHSNGAGLTEENQQHTLARLKAMETTHSGPILAEIDLNLRGPGELFGTRQHGIADLHIAHWTDTALIAETGSSVKKLVIQDPSLTAFPLLRAKLGESTITNVQQD